MRASDRGEPARTARAELEIRVDDRNDFGPEFAGSGRYDVSVAEDAPVGSSVVIVKATDGDAERGDKVSGKVFTEN